MPPPFFFRYGYSMATEGKNYFFFSINTRDIFHNKSTTPCRWQNKGHNSEKIKCVLNCLPC